MPTSQFRKEVPMNYYSIPPHSDELWHYGVKGMRWGVRRYQNEDGTLTNRGKKRYDYRDSDQYQKGDARQRAALTNQYKSMKRAAGKKNANRGMYNYLNEGKDYNSEFRKGVGRRAAKDAGAYAALMLATRYGLKRASQKIDNTATNIHSRLRGGLNEYVGPSMGSRAKSKMRDAATTIYRKARSAKNRGKNFTRRRSNALTLYSRQGPTWRSYR